MQSYRADTVPPRRCPRVYSQGVKSVPGTGTLNAPGTILRGTLGGLLGPASAALGPALQGYTVDIRLRGLATKLGYLPMV